MRDQPRNHRACRFLLFQEINPRSDHSYEKSFTHRGKSFTLIQLKRNHDHAPSFLSPESISEIFQGIKFEHREIPQTFFTFVQSTSR